MNKFFATVLAAIFFVGAQVSAAQPKAQEYREILSSKNFYVEYDDKHVKRIVAQEHGWRMARTNLGGAYRAIVSILNPLGAAFSNDNYPEFMCAGKKFYKFIDNDFALMVREDQLNDENLNPAEGWATIYQSLSLPDELVGVAVYVESCCRAEVLERDGAVADFERDRLRGAVVCRSVECARDLQEVAAVEAEDDIVARAVEECIITCAAPE